MAGSLSVSASRPVVKHSLESLRLGIDFRRLLATGETLSPPVTVIAEPAGLTIGSPTVNPLPFDDELGGSVPTGQGVQFRVQGGDPAIDYRLTVTVQTTGGNTRAAVCQLQVRDT